MKYSLKACLCLFVFVSMWLGVMISRSSIGLEVASTISILTIFLALPLAIFDSKVKRRPFWAGYFAVGFGFFLMLFAGLSIDKSSDELASIFSRLPGASSVPDAKTTQIIPVSFTPSNGGSSTTVMQSVSTTISFHESIKDSLPFLFGFLFAVLGGAITHAAGNQRQPQLESPVKEKFESEVQRFQ